MFSATKILLIIKVIASFDIIYARRNSTVRIKIGNELHLRDNIKFLHLKSEIIVMYKLLLIYV